MSLGDRYGLVSDSDSEDEAMTTGPETERQMKRPLGGDASVSMTQSDEAVGMQEGSHCLHLSLSYLFLSKKFAMQI